MIGPGARRAGGHRGQPREERGLALVIALLVMGVLLLLGTAFMTTSSIEAQIARNQRDSVVALYVAEAGIERAKAVLDALKVAGQSFTVALNQWPFGQDPDSGNHLPVRIGPVATGGNYLVRITDNIDEQPNDPAKDSDEKVIATSTGVFRTARRLLVATLGPRPAAALLAGGNLQISGDPVIEGSGARVHSNGNITIPGDPRVGREVTATGTYASSGNPVIGGSVRQGVAPRPLPAISPPDYRASAEYELRADGRVYVGYSRTDLPPGTFLADATGASYQGWLRTGTRWMYQGNDGFSGTYYVEGHAEIGSNPGESGLRLFIPAPPTRLPAAPRGTITTPWQVSIVATGDIVMSGNPTMVPRDARGYLLLAGSDIRISGNPRILFPAIIAAHEQIHIDGNPTLVGFVLAEDGGAHSATVTRTVISGNPTIAYGGFPTWPWPGGVTVLTWQEVPE